MGLLNRRKEKKETPPRAEKRAPASDVLKAAATVIIRRPWVSEKASRLASTGTYVFEVAKSATRVEIGKAIFALYGIRPVSVHIARVVPRQVRFGRSFGTTRARKKALVTLPHGSRIDVYEGV
ncbi:50S ribosomal protein L23 [Candidatus Uhrbacteria bacterium]|nr:50S ribosomal protein L23 [Candidatus Uhrbacteria bacterium]